MVKKNEDNKVSLPCSPRLSNNHMHTNKCNLFVGSGHLHGMLYGLNIIKKEISSQLKSPFPFHLRCFRQAQPPAFLFILLSLVLVNSRSSLTSFTHSEDYCCCTKAAVKTFSFSVKIRGLYSLKQKR